MKINTEDKIVQAVIAKMDKRFLVDVQEEIMDALLYIEAAKTCINEKKD